jgi:hypothetical protein
MGEGGDREKEEGRENRDFQDCAFARWTDTDGGRGSGAEEVEMGE